MQAFILLVHVLLCVAIIALVLLQQGKGAEMGAAFGSGASNTLFGSRGPASFLMKVTSLFVALFFITSLGLDYYSARVENAANQLSAPAPQTADILPPVAPAQTQKK